MEVCPRLQVDLRGRSCSFTRFHRGMTRPFFSKDRISDFDNFDRHATTCISLIKERMSKGEAVDFQVSIDG